MNSLATAPPPPVGEASEQLISESSFARTNDPIIQVVAINMTTSSRPRLDGLHAPPSIAARKSSKIPSMMERRGRLKQQPKVALPTKCRISNSLHSKSVSIVMPRLIKSACFSPANLYQPLRPSRTPPCKQPLVAPTNLLASFRGRPFSSQRALKRRCRLEAVFSNASAH